jgi:hypothetical protein
MAKSKSSILTIRHSETSALVFQCNKETKQGDYYLIPNSTQGKFIKTIKTVGFDKLPSGLNREGKGLPKGSGWLLLRSIKEKFDEFDLIIDKENSSSIIRTRGRYKITLNHAELKLLIETVRAISTEKFQAQISSVSHFLASQFPNVFDAPDGDSNLSYKKNSLARLLEQQELLENLSAQDIDKLGEFYPTFLKYYGDKLKGTTKLVRISASKRATEIVYLDKIVREYEKKLQAKAHNENAWQKFLSEYILIFNSNYATSLEKGNITLRGKYPDFMLLDAYNCLDIYEIKKPNTNLLKLDESRGNYYWDVDLAKAISQVENYVYEVERNQDSFEKELRRWRQVEVKILKPRGFIIAGTRKQLEDKNNGEILEMNFRLLNNSLKNVEVILYDDLLNNLKRFLERLKSK